MTTLLIIIGSCFAASLGISFGRLQERAEWNKLIEEGKLPKPSNRNSYGKIPRS
jgi:hypothetical protein